MTVIKICGIRSLAEAEAAIDSGADFIGFNFYPKSVRFIDPGECARITPVVKRGHPSIKLVGVFVNSTVEDVKSILERCSLDLAQLHGDETPGFMKKVGGRAFKAFRGVPAAGMEGFLRTEPPAFLLDASVQGVYGGTGRQADWGRATELALHQPFFLAGGLDPLNVAEAVRQVNPWGVDVASGVESAPGRKDMDKMRAFVEAVRSVVEVG